MKYWASSKILLGGLLVFLLIVVIWFPLLFMSFINSAYISNIPVDATFTLSVGGYQVGFLSLSIITTCCISYRQMLKPLFNLPGHFGAIILIGNKRICRQSQRSTIQMPPNWNIYRQSALQFYKHVFGEGCPNLHTE